MPKEIDNTNADDKLIGFDYQFYYFILSLLKIKKGEKVGFEVKEDVHTENDKKLVLCQLKHTIKTNSKGEPINLSTSNNDLWKTLSLWVDKINKETKQKEFLDKTSFVFVSNKSNNDKNEFLSKFNTFKNEQDIEEFKDYLNNYKLKLLDKYNESIIKAKCEGKKEPNKDIKIDYIENILGLDVVILDNFFKKIGFELNSDNLQDEIKYEIKHTMMIKSDFRVDRVFESILGLIKDDSFFKIKNRENVEYTKEEFSEKVSIIFEKYRSDKIAFISTLDGYISNEKIMDRIFAKQLKGIGIDDEEIYEYDYSRQLTQNNLKELYQGNEITNDDISKFNKNAIDNWKPLHKKKYIKKEESNEKAQELLYDILEKDLYLSDEIISEKSISNGQFLLISDIPKIGWKYKWKESL